MAVKIKSTEPVHGRTRRPRKESAESSGLLIEEVLPDDIGYDADIEVIRPDYYEDAESRSGSECATHDHSQSVDDELAEKMRRLGRERVSMSPQISFIDRGRKRTSLEFDDDGSILDASALTDLEVQEVADHIDQPSPAKRRKKRSKRTDMTTHTLSSHMEAWTDSSERADVNTLDSRDGSLPLSPTSETPGGNDGEAMDIT